MNEICLGLGQGVQLDTQEYLCVKERVMKTIEASIGEYPKDNTITGVWALPLDYYHVVVEKRDQVFTIIEAKPLETHG